MENTRLPLEAIKSDSAVVLVAEGMRLVSEHDTKIEAEKELCRFARESPGENAALFRRIGAGWAQSSVTE